MTQTRSTTWDSDKISELRTERGQSQAAFGLELYATTEGTAQTRVWEMENGERTPSTAVVRTLERMEDGGI